MSISKKIVLGILACLAIYVSAVVIYYSATPTSTYDCPVRVIEEMPLEDSAFPGHVFKTINDASCLNRTRVYDIIPISSTEDIRKALVYARKMDLHVSIAGARHSMGGQAFYKDTLVLDMTGFNRILSLDQTNKVLTVQSGATWHDIQLYLHEKNLAVNAMQSSDIFTVGGSISVNAHGMDHIIGSVASTLRSCTIMLADGSIKRISPQENTELFNAVVGGYGLFGVILEAELYVRDNAMYRLEVKHMDYAEYPEFFKKHSADYELLYAHLSTSPISLLRDVIVYGYKKIKEYKEPFPPLQGISLVRTRRLLINLSKVRAYARVIKWIAEKYIDPYLLMPLKNNIIVSRNQVMHDSVEYLENILIDETDILHEYFIPADRFVEYISRARNILKKSTIQLLNASVRYTHKQTNLLNYAPQNMFALVLYLNQPVKPGALEAMKELTKELIDLTLSSGGTFFLPYQLYYTPQQLRKAYPTIDEFFKLKKKYDPELMFINYFYKKYA